MLYRKIDTKTGMFIEDVMAIDPSAGLIATPCPAGFYWPKWDGKQWIEGRTTAEINAIKATETGSESAIITPEDCGYVANGNQAANDKAIDLWIAKSLSGKKLAKAHNLKIGKSTSFKGMNLEITGEVLLQSYVLELGGSSDNLYNPHQFIEKIITANADQPKVFIRGSSTQRIAINYYNGELCFRLNNTDKYVGYSRFDIGYCPIISIKNDDNIVPDGLLWCNENQFFLRRVGQFKMDGSYSHNNNRIYGGCFEGNKRFIEIIRGIKNTFYDLRFECTGPLSEVYFGPSSTGNVINTTYNEPNITGDSLLVTDLGFANSVRFTKFQNSKLVYSSTCSASNLADARFRCSLAADTSFIVPSNIATGHNDNQKILFESDFLKNPKGISFNAEVTCKTGNGFRMGYNIYDTNFDLIDGWDNLGFYIVSNIGSGYSLPQNGAWGYADESSIKLVNIVPSSRIVTDDAGSQIKYVKFFLYTTTDTTNVFSTISVDIFDLQNSI